MKKDLTPSSRFIAIRLRLMAHLCATHLYERSMRMLIRRREKAHPIRQKICADYTTLPIVAQPPRSRINKNSTKNNVFL